MTVVDARPTSGAPEIVLPSADDPIVAGAVSVGGGPPGRPARVGGRRLWTPVRVIVVLTLLTCTLGFLQKAPCRTHVWDKHQYQYTHLCYTDVFALYFAEGLSDGQRPYLDHPVEYPVVMGAAMEIAAKAVQPFAPDQRGRHFYDVTWALLTACAVVVAVTTARLAGRRPWDAALFALAPGLALHGTTNWDLIAMALAGVGLLLWARRRPAAAGVLLGLATAAKLYPILFLVPLGLLCLRSRKIRPFLVTTFAALLATAAVSVPVYLASPYFADVNGAQTQVATRPLDRLGGQGINALSPHVSATLSDGRTVTGVNSVYRFFDLNATRGADWDSLWFALQTGRGTPLDSNLKASEAPHRLNRGVAVTFLALLIGIGVLALRAPSRPRLPQLLFLTTVAFLLTNKVFSPQYAIWLLPLAVLARPRWRPFLLWQAAEALVLFTRFYFFLGLDGSGHGIGVWWFLTAVMLRDLALVGYAALVIRDILRPEHDVVRAIGQDDPAGGVLTDAAGRAVPDLPALATA
ncbi:MAG: glycosyltransferase 87 family protein [Mycobacteriales bacterium]